MQVIISPDEIAEAIRQYMWQRYGMAVPVAYTTYPYKRGHPRDGETIWAVEFAPMDRQRPMTQLQSAVEAEAAHDPGGYDG